MTVKNNGSEKIKKRYLSNEDKKIAGVCGSRAKYFEIYATVIRLGWVILTLVTGVVPGLVAYIAAILIVPKQGRGNLQELQSHHA